MAKAFGGLIGEIEAGPGETRRPGGLRLRRRHPGALRRPGTVLARRLKSHPNLGERLARAGVSPGGDPVLTWKRLHAVEGRRATVIDLYRLVSEPIGLEPHQLPLEERSRLSAAIAAVFWPGFQVTAGSERTDLIRVVPYDKRWPSRFASWRHLIANSRGKTDHRHPGQRQRHLGRGTLCPQAGATRNPTAQPGRFTSLLSTVCGSAEGRTRARLPRRIELGAGAPSISRLPTCESSRTQGVREHKAGCVSHLDG